MNSDPTGRGQTVTSNLTGTDVFDFQWDDIYPFGIIHEKIHTQTAPMVGTSRDVGQVALVKADSGWRIAE